MKKERMISTVLIIMLSTAMLGMSGDGGQQPVAPKKEVVNVSPQESPQSESMEITGQTELVKESATVKDRLGIDTGMIKEELTRFKEDFLKKAISLEIPWTDAKNIEQDFLKWKVNLNAYEIFKSLGVDLRNVGAPAGSKSHLENALYSDVVIIGEVTEIVNVDDQKFYNSINKVNVIEVLKGKELIKAEFMGTINVPSKTREDIYYSDSKLLSKGEIILFFLNCKNGIENQFASRPLSERIIKGDKLYSNSGNILIGDFNSEIEKIKKIIDINDSDNFYKRSYKLEE